MVGLLRKTLSANHRNRTRQRGNAVYFIAARREPSGITVGKPGGLRRSANRNAPQCSQSKWHWASARQCGSSSLTLRVTMCTISIDAPRGTSSSTRMSSALLSKTALTFTLPPRQTGGRVRVRGHGSQAGTAHNDVRGQSEYAGRVGELADVDPGPTVNAPAAIAARLRRLGRCAARTGKCRCASNVERGDSTAIAAECRRDLRRFLSVGDNT
jgi:hypothetical protein